jgi:hypothetical protein
MRPLDNATASKTQLLGNATGYPKGVSSDDPTRKISSADGLYHMSLPSTFHHYSISTWFLLFLVTLLFHRYSLITHCIHHPRPGAFFG